jgi:hypothetical protein
VNIPRIVYCKESNKSLEGCSSFFPDEVKRQTLKYNHSALNIIDVAKGIAGYEADDEEIREAMLQLLNDAWDKNSRCWKEPSIDLASAFKARANYGLWNLANLLREELEDEGHTVISLEGVETNLVGEMADIKDEQKMEEATLISEASTIPVEEARKILNRLGETKEKQRSAQKTLLQEELPEVSLTPEFVKKAVVHDRRRWLNQHKLFWYYSNLEAVKQIDTDHWLSNLKRFAEGTPFMRDMRSHAPKADALRKTGIFEFINLEDCDRIYQGDTPEAKAFMKQCLGNKDDLQTALNVLVTKKSSPISLANRILSKVGLRLEKLTRSNKDSRHRLSADLVSDPDRVNVLKAFELRWQMSQQEAEKKLGEKQAQAQFQQAIQPGGESPYYIDQDIDSPPIFEGVSQGDTQFTVETAAARKSELEQLIEAEKKSTEKQAQTQSQQAIQMGGESPCYIDQDIDSPPIFEGVSQGNSQFTVDAAALQKTELEQLLEALPFCDSAEDFAAVVEDSLFQVVEDAIALQDTQPRRLQLQGWLDVVRQSTFTTHFPQNEAEPVRVGQRVWAWIGAFRRWGQGVVSAILQDVSWDVQLEGEPLDMVKIYQRNEIEPLGMSG